MTKFESKMFYKYLSLSKNLLIAPCKKINNNKDKFIIKKVYSFSLLPKL